MTPDVSARWRQADALFQRALDLPAADRPAFLADADPALRAEVEAMLDEVDALLDGTEAVAADALLDRRPHWPTLPDALTSLSLDAGPALADAAHVGPYRVGRLLGRGGMGEVYEAERADGAFRQRVAVKTVRAGLSAAAAERFRQERALLARLEHPGITRLLDGGLDADGRPWLAMEYVEGEPITDYCDRHRLGVEARLRLFLQACEAVHYAHQRLVVHRDLKPSNVLVTPEGRVKLLDFGIATLVQNGEDDADLSALVETQAGQRLLTPHYAAPEQVRGEAVTTATDVYALGVLLAELLAGRRPYRQTSGRASAYEAERAAVEAEAERPSTAVGRAEAGGPTAEAVAAARGTTPQRLRRLLAGDLDAIVLKALRKAPAQRFASAEAMAEDVARFLDGLPVRARRGTAAYRAGRFARRHAVAVGAAALVVLALVGGLAAAVRGERRAAREAARATAVSDFLVETLGAADPFGDAGPDVRVADVLAAAAERAGTALSGQPDVEASVRGAIGDTYVSLGLLDEAEGHLRRALALRERAHGADAPATAEDRERLGYLLVQRGDYEAAEAELRRALALVRQAHGPDAPEAAPVLNTLSMAVEMAGRYDEAEALAREAVRILSRVADPGAASGRDVRADLTDALGTLATALYRQGRLAEVEVLYEEALRVEEARLGPDHPDVAVTLNNLALTYSDQEKHAEAEAAERRSLAILRQHLGRDHPLLSVHLGNLAMILQGARRFEEAEAPAREALAIRRRHLPPGHPDLAFSLNRLGAVLLDRGDARAAEAPLREALAIGHAELGPDHLVTLRVATKLAEALHAQGRRAEAEPLYRDALALLRAEAPDHLFTADALLGLGTLLGETDRPQEAEEFLREAVRIRRAALPAGSRQVEEAERALEVVLSIPGANAAAR